MHLVLVFITFAYASACLVFRSHLHLCRLVYCILCSIKNFSKAVEDHQIINIFVTINKILEAIKMFHVS